MPNTNPRVIIAMSGGVDSSVSALLLKQQGYDVQGLFMKNWEEDDTDTHCSASLDIADAQAVCDQLDIPLHKVNFSAEYWDNVFENFLQEYRAGRTPNPDILCNKEIKFKAFLAYALELGAEYMATGHYAKRRYHNNEWKLIKAADTNKDQSYFLYTLTQKQLEKSLFPLGDLTKPEVRHIAAQMKFPNHAKRDSTGICFIGERKFKNFLTTYFPAQPGEIETIEGKRVGQHDGLMYHTIGQRKGLKIGGKKDAGEAAWYVVAKDLARNVLIVTQGHDHPALFSHVLICQQVHWIAEHAPALPLACTAKTRYRQAEQPCVIQSNGEMSYRVTFSTPQWAVTPGQSIVFYRDEICLGGGIIENCNALQTELL